MSLSVRVTISNEFLILYRSFSLRVCMCFLKNSGKWKFMHSCKVLSNPEQSVLKFFCALNVFPEVLNANFCIAQKCHHWALSEFIQRSLFLLKISPNGCRPAKSGNYIKLKFVENVLRFLEHFEFLTLRICLCTNWLEVQSSWTVDKCFSHSEEKNELEKVRSAVGDWVLNYEGRWGVWQNG